MTAICTRTRPIDALGPEKPYRATKRQAVLDVTGQAVAELTLAPALYVARVLDRLRSRPAVSASWTTTERYEKLLAAAKNFESASLGGFDPDEHHRLVARTTGLPLSVVRAATETIADAARNAVGTAERARPRGVLLPGQHVAPGSAAAVWRRRGHLLSVLASGNHPAVHSLWVEAVALGYRVAIRPSRRDPFTAYRLVLALREAGFADEDVLFLPCDHGTADELVHSADLAMVFGGDDVVGRYTGGWSRTPVLPQGPGRVKVLITGPWEQFLDVLVESVSGLGGVSCLNTTAVLVEQDAAGFSKALAERLAALRPLPPESEEAGLPCRPLAEAHAVEEFVRQQAAGAVAVLGKEGIAHDLGDGSAALRPAVHLVDDATAEQIGLEMPFPCVWVAPWSKEHGVAPLRNSLVVGVASEDEALVNALLDESSIRNVYGLDRPTWWLPPGIPHDGFLAEFLMRSTGLARRA
ncbi:acyl-CoA reductase-like NAD-dependent aldehyde dehydrogenase [Kibdelosporangium banguiense]|uniref:Acyl-CoA reductase-like NAD-dependent aldehyde dehydrogenase n=1 Tax=Kibdelosporangium banguiense TaxID=1365924 RepID=A0ABS4U1M7_9PSEU|nr:aldehyde dehydrogenase family protein [Kibdelosporangium banguiense]MBP2330568.1 acyl-CoA reductase-like NAD-dependent aldehyde dehydrogenase [Kibdelosporangium banguiense]